jgi:hypothetical protein
MKAIAHVLDNIHCLARQVERSTRRKKRLRREHIVGAFHVARVLANGIAAVAPKAIPVAVVLNGLNETVVSEGKHVTDAGTNNNNNNTVGESTAFVDAPCADHRGTQQGE